MGECVSSNSELCVRQFSETQQETCQWLWRSSDRWTHFAVLEIDVVVEAQAEAPSPHVAQHCGPGTLHNITEYGARVLELHLLALLDFCRNNETVKAYARTSMVKWRCGHHGRVKIIVN